MKRLHLGSPMLVIVQSLFPCIRGWSNEVESYQPAKAELSSVICRSGEGAAILKLLYLSLVTSHTC